MHCIECQAFLSVSAFVCLSVRVFVCLPVCVSVCQVQNDDGLWLRLTSESIREFCSPLNGFTEGWALQYNQHLAKTLLVPVPERPAVTNDHQRDVLDDRPPSPRPPTHHLAPPRNGQQMLLQFTMFFRKLSVGNGTVM